MNELTTYTNKSSEELTIIMNQVMSAQINKQNEVIKQLQNDAESEKQNNQIRFDEFNINQKRIAEDNEKSKQLEIARHRVEESSYGFVSLGDLGKHFKIHIGSKTMGKLLQCVGIAKIKKNTEPYSSLIQSGFAKSFMYGGYPSYVYNPEKCIKKIDRWLSDNNLLDRFYMIDRERDILDFINKLHSNI